MKPVHIHIKNVGPFIDEQLDFSQLDEVFLLCGDTGAGKTTIFDAMTFALYGEFLGARKGLAMEFRSHFAAEGDVPSVKFEFTSDGEKFRVERNLPYHRLGRNNRMVKKDSEVSFEIWNEGEKKFEFFNGTKTEINAKIQEIIGLEAVEFSKIVVLPQGEFSKFLRANSTEKQEMLKKLFPVDFYHSIVERVKKQNDDLQSEINMVENSRSELTKKNDFSDGSKKLAELEEKLLAGKVQLEKFRKAKEELSRKLTVLEGELKVSMELENSIEEKKVLDKKTPSVEADEKKILLADEADLLVPFMDSKAGRVKEEKGAEKYFEESVAAVKDAEKKFEELKSRVDENSRTEKSMEENKIQLKVLVDRIELAEKYESVLEQCRAAEKRCTCLLKFIAELDGKKSLLMEEQKKIAEEADVDSSGEGIQDFFRMLLEKSSLVEKKASDSALILNSARQASIIEEKISASEKTVTDLEKEKLDCEKQLENSRKLLDEYRQKKEEQITAHTASSLVHILKPGIPCPVCGSTEHPSPAKVSGEFLDMDEKISTVEHSIDSENKVLSSCGEKLAATRELLVKYREDLLRLKNECGSLTEDEAFAQDESARNEMSRFKKLCAECGRLKDEMESIEKRISVQKDELSAAEKDFVSAKASVETLESQMDSGAEGKVNCSEIKAQIHELELLVESQRQAVEKFRGEFMDGDRELGKARTRCEEAGSVLENARRNSAQASEILLKKLAESKFADENEVLENHLEKAEKENLRKQTEEFRSRYVRLENSIDVLSKKISEKPDVLLSKKEELLSKIESMEIEIADLSNAVDGILSEKTSFGNDFRQYEKYSGELASLYEKGAPLAELNKNLSGDNPSKTSFENWFLGLYFDDVVVCANRHLLKISGDRYEFKMDPGKTGGNSRRGLDLLVHDYQTNRDRDSATLSGGETFMASISLALGLTEVVQKTSRMDSLFIDEGFGSLDKESLEMAVGVLQNIGTSRMVGIISHVEEMLGAIACHVEVKKTARGSHISL